MATGSVPSRSNSTVDELADEIRSQQVRNKSVSLNPASIWTTGGRSCPHEGRVSLSVSNHLIKKIPYRCAQRLASWVV